MSEHPGIDRLLGLCRRLLRATQTGNARWTATDNPTSFAMATPHGSILLESMDSDGTRPFVLRVLNADGVEVEKHTAQRRERLDFFEITEQEAEINDILDALYPLARRAALRTDSVLKSIIEDLGK